MRSSICPNVSQRLRRGSYQDDTIETLNETITAQWKQIDMLTRQVAALGERLAEAETAVGTPGNERPPHY